jgi:hypothetical protein
MIVQAAFAPARTAATVFLSVTGASSRVLANPMRASTMRLFNNAGSTSICFVDFGDVTITAATVGAIPIIPNTVNIFRVFGQSYVAGIVASGSATLYCTPGEGGYI